MFKLFCILLLATAFSTNAKPSEPIDSINGALDTVTNVANAIAAGLPQPAADVAQTVVGAAKNVLGTMGQAAETLLPGR